MEEEKKKRKRIKRRLLFSTTIQKAKEIEVLKYCADEFLLSELKSYSDKEVLSMLKYIR